MLSSDRIHVATNFWAAASSKVAQAEESEAYALAEILSELGEIIGRGKNKSQLNHFYKTIGELEGNYKGLETAPFSEALKLTRSLLDLMVV